MGKVISPSGLPFHGSVWEKRDTEQVFMENTGIDVNSCRVRIQISNVPFVTLKEVDILYDLYM